MTSKHYKELLKAMEIIDEYIFLLKIVLLLIWRWQRYGLFVCVVFMYMCIVFYVYYSLQFLCDLFGRWLSLNLIMFEFNIMSEGIVSCSLE